MSWDDGFERAQRSYDMRSDDRYDDDMSDDEYQDSGQRANEAAPTEEIDAMFNFWEGIEKC